LAFSCDAPGPPWRMLARVFFDVAMKSPSGPADSLDGSY
jgi:hypothetical protein